MVRVIYCYRPYAIAKTQRATAAGNGGQHLVASIPRVDEVGPPKVGRWAVRATGGRAGLGSHRVSSGVPGGV